MKDEYEALLKSGMFWVIFPQMSGNWEKDMPDFIEFVSRRDCNND